MLYRHALGYTIRTLRTTSGLTLRDVAHKAPMALGYLSEVERGQKEVSSEVLVSIATALETTASALIRNASETLADWEEQEVFLALARLSFDTEERDLRSR